MNQQPKTINIVLALLSVYLIWGSTYLAIKYAVSETGFPPLIMGGIRFLIAGSVLFIFLISRREPLPSRSQWIGASVLASLLLLCGNGGVIVAEYLHVDSGLAALIVATVPLWSALFSVLFGYKPTPRDWVGLALGFIGIALLNVNGKLTNLSLGALALIFASACWALGSVIGKRLTLPSGLMASAAQMLAGGVMMVTASVISGEKMAHTPDAAAWFGLVYLILFGSLIGFSAFTFLIKAVRPALATSYAYVNPIVAMILGVFIAGENVGVLEIAAMIVILIGVGIVVTAKK